ncbi:MAG: hypothetical protein AAB729_04280, partial [Patescibacteria group bacterium]
MFSYTAIIRKAYTSSINNPRLWLFGLFVVGGFNLNFLQFQNIPLKKLVLENRPSDLFVYLQARPGTLAAISAAVLLFALVGLAVTNWSRIMLILLGRQALETHTAAFKQSLQESKSSLTGIIKISLLTTALMCFVAVVLIVPTLWLPMENPLRFLLLEASVVAFLPLAFIISCINIFTAFYVVLHKMPLNKALNCGIDFFISVWPRILGLVAVLMVIYLASFTIGVSVIFLAKEVLRLLLLILVRFHILPLSAIILVLKTISTVLFWFLLSGLSVFFNQSLLVLFLELSKPIEDP